MRFKINYLVLLLFLGSFQSIAQESKAEKPTKKLIVSGNITESNGLPLTGAKILIRGTTEEITTNFDGEFSLEVVSGTILSISYTGFKTTEVLIEPKAQISFVLKEENSNSVPAIISKKEMRKIRRADKLKNIDPSNIDHNLVETLFGVLKVVTKN